MTVVKGRRRVTIAAVLVLAGILAATTSTGAVAGPSKPPKKPACQRVLVLSAMPLELNPLVAKAELDPSKTVRAADHTFYVGRLAGNDVVMAITWIGMVNAAATTEAAIEHFGCFRAAIFSGVAGSRHNIGDVAVPSRWTFGGEDVWFNADTAMVATAKKLEGTDKVALSRDVPVGDAACLCPGVDAATPVQMPQPMKVVVGGLGTTDDMFGGHGPPCLPGGGDVAGCQVCLGPNGTPEDAANFASDAPDLLSPDFFQGFLQPPEETTESMDAQDMETTAFAEVARAHKVPFLAVRAASDGQGDPLHLPGFPAQFFAYRQLAGNNAAAVTIAFLETWAAAGRPVEAVR